MPFMEFIRDSVTESAANTYTETEIKTPASRTEKLAMLIWQMEIEAGLPDIEDAQSNATLTQLVKTTQNTGLGLQDEDLLMRVNKLANVGTVQGSLTEFQRYQELDASVIRYFDPPILYAKAEMFLGIVGSGNAAAGSSGARVGYTLERVASEEFIAALVD